MKKNITLLLLALLSGGAMAQTEPANYAMAVSKIKTFYNGDQPDSIYKMFAPQVTSTVTLDGFKTTMTQLKSQLGYLSQTTFASYTAPLASYTATFKSVALALNVALNAQNQLTYFFFKPIPAPAPAATAVDPAVSESPISDKTLAGTIRGTLTMPKDVSGKIPVVLIIAGSGPTDRNGNSSKLDLESNAYEYLAWGLAKNGIASVRYDKRMVGESQTGNKEADLRFDDYVDDAVNLIQMLNDDQRFSKVIVLGHSEGSLVGMLASRGESVKAYISIAGAGQSADKLVTEQLKSKSQLVQDNFKILLDTLKKGKTLDNVDPSLWFIARPTIQRYLMSWFRYDPARVLKTLKMPILIIQGTTDLQVTVADADRLKKAKSDATEIIIPGMNHILKDAPADRDQNLATYTKPDLPLKAELVPDIVKFINGVN
jgi:hypothetical protein